ncbi:MAG: hypothetical protein HYY49_12245 [Ignavibacteriales bacterium]|nr:hypothetical protein [Ignavibacteriales bacterium]
MIELYPSDVPAVLSLVRPSTSYGSYITLATQGVEDWNFGVEYGGTDDFKFKVSSTAVMTLMKSNGYVGIGTTSPSNKLTVSGNVDFTGNVGIGTTTPGQKLDIVGNTQISGGNPFFLTSTGTGTYNKTVFYHDLTNGFYIDLARASDYSGATPLDFNINARGGGANFLKIKGSNGYIGVGTLTPQSKLAVNGTITCREVIVTQSGWPDFVFDESYKLMPLPDVENFIKTNKHLPNIPSAGKVETNGLNVGEMQSKLLQKVEELTLYVIQLQKRNKELETRLEKIERD